jgi:uncharacterized protein YndB with AHSA1/START domain
MERKPPSAGWQKDSVTVSREIAAAPDAVFRMLTEPEELLRWWGGPGGLTRAHANLRPGGEYRLDFQTGWVRGQYQIVEPGRRLLMTWFSSVHPDLRNSLELRFDPLTGGGTKLIAVHGGLAGHGEVLKEYERIWKETLDRLAAKAKGRG